MKYALLKDALHYIPLFHPTLTRLRNGHDPRGDAIRTAISLKAMLRKSVDLKLVSQNARRSLSCYDSQYS